MTAPIRILHADDHPVVLDGFASALEQYDIHTVAKAHSVEQALAQYRQEAPDVAILDLRFGSALTGLDAARQLLAEFPKAKIVFLSQFDQDSLIKEAYRLGAHAFITKDCTPQELAQAVRQAHAGQLYFMPAIAERLANLSIRGDHSPQSLLDERELQIFTRMAEGLTNQEIADQLQLSSKTISNTSQTIKDKLGVQRAADITRLALKHGLLSA
ncbi:response regulator transcription factor [Massilia sp. W12]|uniref:response regulator transcription factor n=1 Tax=Massilia sp. W12 TaxID=3126507 RepID=UPI0030CC994E